MSNQKRVVILTGRVGMGHLSVASALDYWTRKFGYNSEVIDIIPASSDRIYQLMMKVPQVNTALYRSSNNLTTAEILTKNFLPDFNRKLKKYSPLSQNADVVISTHPFIHPTIGKKKVMVVLDPLVHATYCSEPLADKYYVFWHESIPQLKKYHLASRNIYPAHPLARESFYLIGQKVNSFEDKHKHKRKLGLDPELPLGLVIAGGDWIERIKPYLEHLSAAFPPGTANLAFVCGQKRVFAQKMRRKYPQNNFIFLDWLTEKQMAEWMAAADFSVALTLAQMSVESGLCRLPIYIFDLIDGQEDDYRQIIERRRVGLSVYGTPKKQVETLKKKLSGNQKAFDHNLARWQKQLLNGPEEYRRLLKHLFDTKNKPLPSVQLQKSVWQQLREKIGLGS